MKLNHGLEFPAACSVLLRQHVRETIASYSMCGRIELIHVPEGVAADGMIVRQHVLEVDASDGMCWRMELKPFA